MLVGVRWRSERQALEKPAGEVLRHDVALRCNAFVQVVALPIKAGLQPLHAALRGSGTFILASHRPHELHKRLVLLLHFKQPLTISLITSLDRLFNFLIPKQKLTALGHLILICFLYRFLINMHEKAFDLIHIYFICYIL